MHDLVNDWGYLVDSLASLDVGGASGVRFRIV